MKAVIVYQAGIANVFRVERAASTAEYRGQTTRLLQHAFTACEYFAKGLQTAGCEVVPAWCNEAGDIAGREWHYSGFDNAPFSDSFRWPGSFASGLFTDESPDENEADETEGE